MVSALLVSWNVTARVGRARRSCTGPRASMAFLCDLRAHIHTCTYIARRRRRRLVAIACFQQLGARPLRCHCSASGGMDTAYPLRILSTRGHVLVLKGQGCVRGARGGSATPRYALPRPRLVAANADRTAVTTRAGLPLRSIQSPSRGKVLIRGAGSHPAAPWHGWARVIALGPSRPS